MITYSKLGSKGRGNLGNQFFQIASTVGMALQRGHNYSFPAWSYSQYFKGGLPTGGSFEAWPLEEKGFHFQEERIAGGENWNDFEGDNYDVDGWRQTEKYWKSHEQHVRDLFQWEPKFLKSTRDKWKRALAKPTIAISVRRGDFVDNPNYAQVPIRFYLLGLLEEIPNWKDHNVLIFSDDIQYCRVQFEGLPNAFFCGGPAIEQLCVMSQCKHFVISNSTFSWWGAYLGEVNDGVVVRPPVNFAGKLASTNFEGDFWPDRWKVCDYRSRKLNLRDMTFTIPVFIDHRHRMENLQLNVAVLQRDFHTNIIVGEQGSSAAQKLNSLVTYVRFDGIKAFHRTRMLNEMAKRANTLMVANWDADVFVPPLQIWLACERIRQGQDMVYPFDGRFARVPRSWHDQLRTTMDVGIFGDTHFTGKNGKPLPTASVGGAIFFLRSSFLNAGGENEYMISFGPEDWERNYRFKTLGYTVTRVPGCLYHLDHWCGPNSSSRNPYFKHNHAELDKLRAMPAEELENYVSAWPWR
jgi:hypothetical protein